MDRLDEAEAVYAEFLPIMKRVLGPEHPMTLNTGTDRARAAVLSGRFTDGIAMLEATLEVQTRVFGADNQTTLNTSRMLSGLRAMLASDRDL
jgi:hypothetical protein